MPYLQKILTVYYVIVNLILFLLMGLDKWKAVHRQWRIPEITLFTFSLLGGSIGGLVGMNVFHHKTKKGYFYLIYITGFLAHTFLGYVIMKYL